MPLFNLENNIREKLENRELKPSSEAWQKLEVQLDKKQPKRKMVLWYYVAASLIGVLILSSIFFTQNNVEGNHKIVDGQMDESTVEKQPDIIPGIIDEVNIASEEGKINPEQVKHSENNSRVDKKIEEKKTIADVSGNKVITDLEQDAFDNEEALLIDKKANQVAASIKTIHDNNSEVKAEEVEILLNNARNEIKAKRILQSNKVDAMALLEEAEWELDKSFRDKVFDALGEGFEKLRTAISMRND